MVFVNLGGGNYEMFNHALWDGLTFADTVFPSFMWIMGVSMALSMKKIHLSPKLPLLKKIIKRTIILFMLGIIVNNCRELKTLRIMGVLQRFAISYFINSLIVLYLPLHKSMKPFKNMYFFWRWVILIIFPLSNLLVTFLVKYSSHCPISYKGPGGLQIDQKKPNIDLYGCTGGINYYLDKWVLGEKHIFDNPSPNPIYETGPYDPEGLFGS